MVTLQSWVIFLYRQQYLDDLLVLAFGQGDRPKPAGV
jgi:hypothetical protein